MTKVQYCGKLAVLSDEDPPSTLAHRAAAKEGRRLSPVVGLVNTRSITRLKLVRLWEHCTPSLHQATISIIEACFSCSILAFDSVCMAFVVPSFVITNIAALEAVIGLQLYLPQG